MSSIPPAPSARLLSLDVFRGATIAGMILVNNPGSWRAMYAPLGHADWHGATPTDWIFPFFLFIVGVAIPFSQARRVQTGGSLFPAILRRSAILFALGLLLAAIPSSATSGLLSPSTLRIPGVLQRIAVCYLVAATLAVYLRPRAMIGVGVALLAAYSGLMFWGGDLSRDGNLAHRIDSAVFGAHGYRAYNDPEGLLSTLPAIATVIGGWLVGVWLRRADKTPNEKAAAILAFGVLGHVAGILLHHAFMPINKQIWTPSFVVYTAGLACLGLGVCYWLIDILGYRRWAIPLAAMGMNAIAIFVLAGIVAKAMAVPVISSPAADASATRIGLKPYLYNALFVPVFEDPRNASLAWAILFVAIFVALAMLLHQRRIYFKV